MVGRVIGNRYKIIQKLGEGGMAVVYLGQDLILNRHVTVKALRDEYARDEEFIRRFRQEARSAAGLSHPNIVSVFDVGCEDGVHYLVMEYVEGRNLKSLIQEGKVSTGFALQTAYGICDALGHAHKRGIIHRDVKPHNILITPEGRAKLTDFGIARAVSSGTVSATKALVGSVQYISPEQARGEPADARSDIYSLGAVLYEMLTGRPPFLGENPVAVAIKHIQDNPAPVSQVNPRVPRALSAVVEKAMAKNPDLRYQSVTAMAEDIADLLEDLPDAECPARPFNDKKPKKRRLKPAGYAAVSLFFILLLTAGWWALKWYVYVPEVSVPDVQGMTVEAAGRRLDGCGLRYQVQEIHHKAVEKGKVIKQDIEPGSRVKRGRLITLLVSLGPQMLTVPDVCGKLVQDAELLLINEGFAIGNRKEIFHERVKEGLVISQDPVPGVSQPKDSPVSLVVSKGPRPVLKPVPDLLGLVLAEAREKLHQAGLVLNDSIERVASTEYLPGYVCAQSPAPGTNLETGKSVQVTVSDGPGPLPKEAAVYIPVPDDGREHSVRITVSDARGLTEAYKGSHNPGERVVQEVTYYGGATIRVYLDNRMVHEKTFPS